MIERTATLYDDCGNSEFVEMSHCPFCEQGKARLSKEDSPCASCEENLVHSIQWQLCQHLVAIRSNIYRYNSSKYGEFDVIIYDDKIGDLCGPDTDIAGAAEQDHAKDALDKLVEISFIDGEDHSKDGLTEAPDHHVDVCNSAALIKDKKGDLCFGLTAEFGVVYARDRAKFISYLNSNQLTN